MTLPAKTRLGPYELVAQIGAGGMGEVYRARDTRLQRQVAIKFLLSHCKPSPERLRRFEQEANALAALNHPHILVVHDVGTHEGLPFLVSEFLEGKTLRERIGGTPLCLEELIELGIQITDALSATHAKGFIHRDLKPANIFVTETRQAKLLDFGLSKLLDEVADPASPDAMTVRDQDLLTSPGAVLGTVAYMSPEQVLGEELDSRSDLFSLGVVLYEMSTGKLPFHGNTSAAVFNAILNRSPAPPSELNPRVPFGLDRIIAKALEKDRAFRHQTAADLRADLKRLKRDSESGRLKGQNVTKPDVQKTKPVWFWPAALAASALCGGLLVALLLPSSARMETGLETADNTLAPSLAGPSVPFTSLPGEERHPALSPDGKQIAFAWNGGQGVNWHLYVKQPGVESPLPLTTDPGVVYSPAWSPDGLEIAFYREAGPESGIYLVKAMPSPVRKLHALELKRWQTQAFYDEHYASRVLDWSPDGEWLVFANTNGLALLSMSSLEIGAQLTRSGGQFGDVSPAFSPDGKTIAFVRLSSVAGEIFAVPVSGGEPKALTADRRRVWGLAWTPDGKEIVYGSTRSGTFRLWRISAAGGQPKIVSGTEDYSVSPSMARKAHRLAFEVIQRNVNIWRSELPNGTHQPFIRTSYRASHPAFSPQGDKISYTSDQTGAPEIWICDRSGANPRQLTRFGGPFIGVSRWSPDGREIVFPSRKEGNSDLFIINVASGQVRPLTSEPSNEWMPSWSHDGKWIYFSSDRTRQSQVYKIPASGGPWIQLTQRGEESLFEAPDGKWIYYVDHSGNLARASVSGSLEEVIAKIPGLRVDFPMWAMSASGLYFFNGSSVPVTVDLFEFATGTVRTVLDLGSYLHDAGLAISPDERWFLYTRVDNLNSDIRLIDNFR